MNQKIEPSGLGGWLILPMLGLIFTPIKVGAMLATTFYPLFTEGSWEAITTPGSEVYHAMWAPLIIFEIICNSAFLIAAIVLLVFLFQKHHRFPKLMIWYLALNVAFVVTDFFVADLIPAVAAEPDPSSMKELIRVIIGAAIWIPYFLKSVRVKNTFTNGNIEQGSGDNA